MPRKPKYNERMVLINAYVPVDMYRYLDEHYRWRRSELIRELLERHRREKVGKEKNG